MIIGLATGRRKNVFGKTLTDQQISLTDPDARSMATSGRGTGMVGYNVQTAVEARHHLIVAHHLDRALAFDQRVVAQQLELGGDREAFLLLLLGGDTGVKDCSANLARRIVQYLL